MQAQGNTPTLSATKRTPLGILSVILGVVALLSLLCIGTIMMIGTFICGIAAIGCSFAARRSGDTSRFPTVGFWLGIVPIVAAAVLYLLITINYFQNT